MNTQDNSNLSEMVQEAVKSALENALAILRDNLAEYTYKFPGHTTIDNFYPKTANNEWTNGFCTGAYWLAYEMTNDEAFKESALVHVASFLDRIERRYNTDHHDMGFLYSLSCVAAYQLCGDENGKKAALLAADALLERFHEKGQFLQAWGEIGASDNYRLIIDCLMNLPLLYWASEITGDPIYKEKADAHAMTSLDCLVRPDFSTYHTYFFDPETGEPTKGVTAQGFKDNSAWARGQAWGVYGLALCFKYTGNPRCIELFYPVTDFFLSKLPQDGVPYWDLGFADGDDEPKDSSAAAIVACGMLEMIKYLPKDKAAYYHESAVKMFEDLARGYATTDIADSNGLLQHSVYAKSSPYNTVTDLGVDECSLWGDYFWMELLVRLSKDWELYW